MKKTIKAWAVFWRGGKLHFNTIGETKRIAISMAVDRAWRGDRRSDTWAYLYSIGYRVKPITITAED